MEEKDRYTEAVKKIREGLKPLQDGTKISGVTRAFLEGVFPELKPSKRERIIETLIGIIKANYNSRSIVVDNNLTVGEIIDFLEGEITEIKLDVVSSDIDSQKDLKFVENDPSITEEKQENSENMVPEVIMWNGSDEEPPEDEELLVEWESTDTTWHEVVFYHSDTKAFFGIKGRLSGNVTKWASLAKPGQKIYKGDWLARNDGTYVGQVINVIENLSNHKPAYDMHDGVYISTVGIKNYHLWTIKDAKENDILYSPSHNLLWMYLTETKYKVCANLNYNDSISFNSEIKAPNDTRPATDYQKQILFARILGTNEICEKKGCLK